MAGLHIDFVRAPEQLEAVGRLAQKELVLSLGLIDGRNVWRANLPAILDRVKPVYPAEVGRRFRSALPARPVHALHCPAGSQVSRHHRSVEARDAAAPASAAMLLDIKGVGLEFADVL